jgi:hypothetical protein
MSRFKRTSVRLGLTAVATTALVAGGLTGAQAALQPADTASTVPTIHVAQTDKAMYLEGSTSFPAGRLRVTLEDAKVKHGAVVAIWKLATGYTWKAMRHDFDVMAANLFGPNGNKKKGLKHLNHLINNITAYGGLSAHPGRTGRGTFLLNEPGTYALFNDSSAPRDPRRLTVGAAAGPQTMPTTDATVVALTKRRFGGDKVLPAHGTITFQNNSTESPHFLEIQHVKEGTTRKQVIRALQSNGPGPFLPGDASSDVVSYGHAMTLKLHLPAGEYALMCFFPDPRTGMPHAFMGMVNIVHLK